ncbi:MAG: hypothetical protein APF80_17480 [Alphaproteobacteria bacterium BRH_c36]|nr:MAG: hypothetical protein APF80_17480 [Alphaproteobacteria bacterium BRH_c36]
MAQGANNRDFKGAFIPKDVWCNPALNGDAKLVWGEIFALDNEFGCIASNEHFMEMFGWKNERKVQREIKKLTDLGLISVEQDKRKDRRTMRIVGKYRHLDKRHMEDLEAMRLELIRSMKL